MSDKLKLNANKVVRYLEKPAEQITRKDLIRFIEENEIKMINFRYVGGDGRLKTLNFVINNREYLEQILITGERVDGSSLFPYIEAASSDLYVVPCYRTAFVNPFTEIATVDILCRYYNSQGEPLVNAPETLVENAQKALQKESGMTIEALGELEYYLFSESDKIYPIVQQKGYHESHPFSKWGALRREMMQVISEMGCDIKYGHAEVGNIIHNNKRNDKVQMVQHEIEFLPVPIERAAEQLALAKWAIREVAYKYGIEVSFAPKIIVGHAGSGLHIHTRLVKDGRNMMVDGNNLSDTAKKMIAGILRLSGSLTAFGNTVPTSFLRLVPHQEAPTSICWGDMNRSVLVRVPLGWRGTVDMARHANPMEEQSPTYLMSKQTVELRSPDGSANVHQLLAGIAVAARYGLQMNDGLERAGKLYIKDDAAGRDDLEQLPDSCQQAAEKLLADRHIYEQEGVFQAGMIDKLAEKLMGYQDKGLSEKLFNKQEDIQKLVDKYLYCG